MKAVNAAKYYEAHKEQEKEYVQIAAARPIRAGESFVNGGWESEATQAGYALDHGKGFMTVAELEANTSPAGDLELAVPKEDLDAEDIATLHPIPKGTEIWGGFGKMDCDGFEGRTGAGKYFTMSNFDLTSTFNYAGDICHTQEERIVVDNREPKLTGIILDKETIFDFIDDRAYKAPAGSILYINPDDKDGFTVQSMNLPNTQLRVSAEWTAAHPAKQTTQAKKTGPAAG